MFEVPPDDLRYRFQEQIMEMAGDVAREFGETEEEWRERLRLALFAVPFASASRIDILGLQTLQCR